MNLSASRLPVAFLLFAPLPPPPRGGRKKIKPQKSNKDVFFPSFGNFNNADFSQLIIKTGINTLRSSYGNWQGREQADLAVSLASSGAEETPAPKRCVQRPRCCKHRGSLLKFAAISKYSVTQKPSRFQVREILKQEDKFKPPYFQSTVLIPTFPPQNWQMWRKQGPQSDQKAKQFF